jgi:hypothetical protein
VTGGGVERFIVLAFLGTDMLPEPVAVE